MPRIFPLIACVALTGCTEPPPGPAEPDQHQAGTAPQAEMTEPAGQLRVDRRRLEIDNRARHEPDLGPVGEAGIPVDIRLLQGRGIVDL